MTTLGHQLARYIAALTYGDAATVAEVLRQAETDLQLDQAIRLWHEEDAQQSAALDDDEAAYGGEPDAPLDEAEADQDA